MTDCGGLLVFEELLTAVHLHFNTLLLKLLMQFTVQLCCHLRPLAVQASSQKSSSINLCNCYEILHFHESFLKHQKTLVLPCSPEVAPVSLQGLRQLGTVGFRSISGSEAILEKKAGNKQAERLGAGPT